VDFTVPVVLALACFGAVVVLAVVALVAGSRGSGHSRPPLG
jgi:hypothetical protein